MDVLICCLLAVLSECASHVDPENLANKVRMQGGNVASFQLRLKQLQSSFLATGARLSSEVLASRLQCSLPRFGPALVAASTFLQQLLWTSIWLHSLKAALSSHSREKKGKVLPSSPILPPHVCVFVA